MRSILIPCLALLTFESRGLKLRHGTSRESWGWGAENRKVAVMISGTFARYIVQSTVDHLIAPLAKKGHTVDLFLGLNNANNSREGGDVDLTGHLPHDPFFEGVHQSPKGIEDRITQAVAHAGGQLRSFHLLDHVDVKHMTKAGPFDYGELRNVNWMRLFKVLEDLWGEVEAAEVTSGRKYTHVMILRDDAYWLADFDLEKLLRKHESEKPYVMVQDCGPHSSYSVQKAADNVNDFVFFLSRSAAPYFGKLYTEVTRETCGGIAVSPSCRRGSKWTRSEALFVGLCAHAMIDIKKVDISDIPYQASMLKKSDDPTKPSVCVRYKCTPSGHTFEEKPLGTKDCHSPQSP